MPYVSQVLGADGGPVVIATDWMKAVPDLVGRWVPRDYVSLGTDGFGRSDTRETLRAFFEIDPPAIAAAAVAELARCGALTASEPSARSRSWASTRPSSTRRPSRPGIGSSRPDPSYLIR